MNYNDMALEKNTKYYSFNQMKGIDIVFYILYAIFTIFVFYDPFFDSLREITKLYILVWCFFLVITSKGCIVLKFFHFLIAGWLIYYCFSLLWTPHIEQAQLYIYTIGLMTLLLICLTIRQYDRQYIDSIIVTTQYMSVSLALISIFSIQDSDAGLRETVLIFGETIDPNSQVAFVAYGSGLCLLDILLKKNYRRFFGLFGFSICALSIFRCGSRSGIVILAMQLLISIYAIIVANEKWDKKIGKIILIGLIVLISILLLYKYVPKKTIERLLGLGSLKFTDGTNREKIWAAGWDTFLKSPIFGNGWGAYECHNTFLTFLVDVGLLGSLPFFIVLVCIILKALHKRDAYVLMILIPEMVAAFFIGAQNKRFFWLSIILSTMMVYCVRDNKKYVLNNE